MERLPDSGNGMVDEQEQSERGKSFFRSRKDREEMHCDGDQPTAEDFAGPDEPQEEPVRDCPRCYGCGWVREDSAAGWIQVSTQCLDCGGTGKGVEA